MIFTFLLLTVEHCAIFKCIWKQFCFNKALTACENSKVKLSTCFFTYSIYTLGLDFVSNFLWIENVKVDLRIRLSFGTKIYIWTIQLLSRFRQD